MPRQDAEQVCPIAGEFVEIHSNRWHREGSDHYTNEGSSILSVVDRTGRHFDPVWSNGWTELTPGVTTRYASEAQRVRIYAAACPVKIRFRHWSEYVSYSDPEFCSNSSSESWTTYVSDSSGAHRLPRFFLRSLLEWFRDVGSELFRATREPR